MTVPGTGGYGVPYPPGSPSRWDKFWSQPLRKLIKDLAPYMGSLLLVAVLAGLHLSDAKATERARAEWLEGVGRPQAARLVPGTDYVAVPNSVPIQFDSGRYQFWYGCVTACAGRYPQFIRFNSIDSGQCSEWKGYDFFGQKPDDVMIAAAGDFPFTAKLNDKGIDICNQASLTVEGGWFLVWSDSLPE